MRSPVEVLTWARKHLWTLCLVALGLFVVAGTALAVAHAAPDAPPADADAPAPVSQAAAPVVPTLAAPSPIATTGATGAVAAPRRPGAAYYRRTTSRHVSAASEAGYLPLYKEAARAFGVSWRLVASIHRQETAFSTEPSTYRGLNAFGCCAGPMQFNVTNGPVSTWTSYKQAFKGAQRPASYPHPTGFHPSVYDDFDAIMAAASLLRDSGATRALDGGSWLAAYAYYGHDGFGITYASQVIGRARTWAAHGFCLNCPDDPAVVAALDDAYGVHERQALEAAGKKDANAKAKAAKARAAKRARAKRAAAARERKPTASPKRPAAKAPPRTSTTPSPSTPSPTQTAPLATTSSSTSTTPPPQTPSSPPPAEPCVALPGGASCVG